MQGIKWAEIAKPGRLIQWHQIAQHRQLSTRYWHLAAHWWILDTEAEARTTLLTYNCESAVVDSRVRKTVIWSIGLWNEMDTESRW